MPTLLIALEQSDLPDGVLAEIKALAPGHDVHVTKDRTEIERHLADIDIAVGSFPRDLIAKAPELKWFQQWGAGADWLRDYPEAQAKEFVLTNASGVHPIQISEHIFALLLAFARQLPQALQAQQAEQWRGFGNREVLELYGKTLLLVGVGAIGERTAKVAQAFGMRVVGLRRDPSRGARGVDRMVGTERLHEVLPEADMVVLTVPLTDETYHLLGKHELDMMKDDACLVNIGRGGTIDEAALVEVLESGKLTGVGLDVFEEEPLATDSPLWNQARVVLTAHYAGASPQYDERAFQIFLDNLKRYQAGKELGNKVDKDLGY